jgi:hypothetical protein
MQQAPGSWVEEREFGEEKGKSAGFRVGDDVESGGGTGQSSRFHSVETRRLLHLKNIKYMPALQVASWRQ